MRSKYHRNTILTGQIDAYCLSCENYLKNEDDIELHIEKPIHKKAVDALEYFDKYKFDLIRKIKKGYYCECCNILLSTSAKVGLHISDSTHIDNKATLILKRTPEAVIAYNNVVISNNAWNGFMEDTCVICNIEFESQVIHKSEPRHMLNLIQNKVMFGDENFVYRKIDDSSFQCLTCNIVFGMDSISVHHQNAEHKKLIKCNKDGAQENINVPEPKKTFELINNDNKVKDVLPNKEGAKDSIKPLQNKKDQSSFNYAAAIYGNKSNNSNNKQPNKENNDAADKNDQDKGKHKIDNKLCKENNVKNNNKSGISLSHEYICSVLGVKDYIMNNMCLLCDCTIEPFSIQTHVYDQHHQTMLKMHLDMTKAVVDIDSNSDDLKSKKDDCIENDNSKILDAISTFQRNKINIDLVMNSAKCTVCAHNIDFNYDSINKHIEEHQENKKKDVIEETCSKKSDTLKKTENKVKPENKIPSHSSSRCGDENTKQNEGEVMHKMKLKGNTLQRISMNNLIDKIDIFEMLGLHYCILNRKICISIDSLNSIVNDNGRYRCHVCDEIFDSELMNSHKKLISHGRTLSEIPVIVNATKVDDFEFIREVREGKFHCGCCNTVLSDWANVPNHLKTTEHANNKLAEAWRCNIFMEWEKKHAPPRNYIGDLNLFFRKGQ